MTQTNEREAFEHWYAQHSTLSEYSAWQAWQAARCAELSEPVPQALPHLNQEYLPVLDFLLKDGTLADYDDELANRLQELRNMLAKNKTIYLAPQPSQADLEELERALCVIGVVGKIDGYDVIRRESVIDIVRQRIRALIPSTQPLAVPSGWISCVERLPNQLEVKIKLLDGSEIFAWYQLDGDYYCKDSGREIFIDASNVTHWQPTPPERE